MIVYSSKNLTKVILLSLKNLLYKNVWKTFSLGPLKLHHSIAYINGTSPKPLRLEKIGIEIYHWKKGHSVPVIHKDY